MMMMMMMTDYICQGEYPLRLDCDWTTDPCFQWVDEDSKVTNSLFSLELGKKLTTEIQ